MAELKATFPAGTVGHMGWLDRSSNEVVCGWCRGRTSVAPIGVEIAVDSGDSPCVATFAAAMFWLERSHQLTTSNHQPRCHMPELDRIVRARTRLIDVQNSLAGAIADLKDQPGYRSEWKQLIDAGGVIAAVRAQILATQNKSTAPTEAPRNA